MRWKLAPAAALMAVSMLAAGCSAPAQRPVPPAAVQVEGAGVSCPGGDHAMGEAQLPWTFCYPAGWRYRERLQPSSTPDGFDATFDITDTTPGDGLGKFGFMLIGTYDAGSAADLSSWARSNLGSTDLSPARWGDAREAARLPNGDRLALTAHSVVRLTLRSGAGNLDLEAAMGSRLNTWHFAY